MDYRVQAWKLAKLRAQGKIAELTCRSGDALAIEEVALAVAEETLREAEMDYRYSHSVEFLRLAFRGEMSSFDAIEKITDLLLEDQKSDSQ